jgi:hypothetical protein
MPLVPQHLNAAGQAHADPLAQHTGVQKQLQHIPMVDESATNASRGAGATARVSARRGRSSSTRCSPRFISDDTCKK